MAGNSEIVLTVDLTEDEEGVLRTALNMLGMQLQKDFDDPEDVLHEEWGRQLAILNTLAEKIGLKANTKYFGFGVERG